MTRWESQPPSQRLCARMLPSNRSEPKSAYAYGYWRDSAPPRPRARSGRLGEYVIAWSSLPAVPQIVIPVRLAPAYPGRSPICNRGCSGG